MLSEISLTQQLREYFGGNADYADELMRQVLPKLREIAARELCRERRHAPLSPTELIHEIWIRNLSRASWTVRDRGHFYAIASLAMRRVLTDMARRRLSMRRNGEEPLSFRELVSGNLAEPAGDRNIARIVEIGLLMDRLEAELPDAARTIDMHYFVGFTFAEIADINHLTVRQVRFRWKRGTAWLKRNLNGNLNV